MVFSAQQSISRLDSHQGLVSTDLAEIFGSSLEALFIKTIDTQFEDDFKKRSFLELTRDQSNKRVG